MEEKEEKSEQQPSSNYGYGKRPLWQWILIYVVIGALVYAAIYYFFFARKGGYNYNQSSGQYPTQSQQTSQQSTVTPAQQNQMTVTLASENNSGESGTATLLESNGKVTVTVNLTGYPTDGTVQPVHIHVGGCPGVGAVKYPLTSVTNGQSVTVLNVTLAQLQKELPLAVNVHKSAKEITNYTSCGQLNAQ